MSMVSEERPARVVVTITSENGVVLERFTLWPTERDVHRAPSDVTEIRLAGDIKDYLTNKFEGEEAI
jgi:hypothetical protein